MYIPGWLLTGLAVGLIFYFLKSSRKKLGKKDRFLINLVISYNLDAISEWLKNDREMPKEVGTNDIDSKWGENVRKKTYCIDIVPNGEMGSIFFHRERAIFSNNGVGCDFLDNATENEKRYFKTTKILGFSWEYWREYLGLRVYCLKKPRESENINAILIPLDGIAELQLNGKNKYDKNIDESKPQKIKVPILFDDKNNQKKYIEIWKRQGENWVAYSNGLCSVSATAPISISSVEY